MLGLSKGQRDVLIVTTAIKILLFPAYRSTDFEVHRNWLAITRNLPLKEWYYDTTSEWTLDYPPFFAYFSYLLSLPARFLPTSVSSEILRMSNTPIETWQTVLYMRTTVLVTELVLLVGLLRLAKSTKSNSTTSITLALSLFLHPGFLILDNIHFQYNAFLFGLMIWSLVGAAEGKPMMCATFFAALLNFKHIYVYLAPAWFIYLLRAYIIPPSTPPSPSAFLKISLPVIFTFSLSLIPFYFQGGLESLNQILKRMFPFMRGLMHAYWAPNVWAGVTLIDRVLLKLSTKLPFLITPSNEGIISTSRGLVGDTKFAVLWDVKPFLCFGLTGGSQVLLLTELYLRPNYKTFLRGITHCGFASFMFGWHVHEKAVMLILVPLSLIATQDYDSYRSWLIATVSGTFSLFPLLFKSNETPVKVGYSVLWLVFSLMSYRPVGSARTNTNHRFSSLIYWTETIYLLSFLPLQLFSSLSSPIFSLLFGHSTGVEKYSFLPLMMVSLYCSLGLIWSWIRLMMISWREVKGELRMNKEKLL